MSDDAQARVVWLAAAAAACGVGAHVVGKAARDALFVSTFPPSALPYVFLATGLCMGTAVAIYARVQSRWSPHTTSPRLPLVVAASLVALWFWLRTRSPASTAVLYIWLTISGGLVISAFWSLLSEVFDVRTARRTIGTLTVASSVGGLVGSAATYGLLAVVDARTLVLPVAVLHVLIAICMRGMAKAQRGDTERRPTERAGLATGAREIAASGYLRGIALFITLVAFAGTLGDFMLKKSAADVLTDEVALTELFATFHGVVGGLTLVVQLLGARPLLARKGLAACLLVLPGALVLGGAAFFVVPALAASLALRGSETATRNSFHRAAYELLFVPMSAKVKRTVKLLLDTLVERLADAAGAVALIAIVALGWDDIAPPLLVAACGLGALALVPRLRRGYVDCLTQKLADESAELGALTLAAESDATARHTLALSLDVASIRERLTMTSAGRLLVSAARPPGGTLLAQRARGETIVSSVGLVRLLVSSDAERVRRGLKDWDGKDRGVVPFVIALLEREDLFEAAIVALTQHVDRHVGALGDALLDRSTAIAIRKRIPRALAKASIARASAVLSEALDDGELTVRYHVARALRDLKERNVMVVEERIWASLRHELATLERGDAELLHLFNLLALVLDPEAVDRAHRSITTGDENVRSVALEYLDEVLPRDVRDALWPHLESRA